MDGKSVIVGSEIANDFFFVSVGSQLAVGLVSCIKQVLSVKSIQNGIVIAIPEISCY